MEFKKMIKPEIASTRDAVLEKINSSTKIDSTDKMFFNQMLSHAAEGTNGLSEHDKLQSVSESCFNLVTMFILEKCDTRECESKTTSLYILLEKSKWAIVTALGVISTLLIFRPEVGQILSEIVKHT